MKKSSLASLILLGGVSVQIAAYAAATITIVNGDAAGVAFSDTTVVAPVGGNSGTTPGQQRLNAFQAAPTNGALP